MSATPYVETSILLAALEGETQEMERLLDGMYPNELNAYELALSRVMERVDEHLRRWRDATEATS